MSFFVFFKSKVTDKLRDEIIKNEVRKGEHGVFSVTTKRVSLIQNAKCDSEKKAKLIFFLFLSVHFFKK